MMPLDTNFVMSNLSFLKVQIRGLHCICSLFTSFNPLTPRSDQYLNSPYNSNTLSSRQVIGIKKIIN